MPASPTAYTIDPDAFRRWLRAKNLSRRVLSDRTGISRTSLRYWERGRVIAAAAAERLATEISEVRELLVAL